MIQKIDKEKKGQREDGRIKHIKKKYRPNKKIDLYSIKKKFRTIV